MFTSLVGVDNTGQARSIHTFFTFNTILAIRSSFSIIAILDRDIDGSSRLAICTIHAIGASRACQADKADAVFTGNGDRIFAVLAGDADFTVLARLADCDVLGQLQIIRDLAICTCRFMEQDILASIDVFILCIILTGWRATFYGQGRMRSTGFISFCIDIVVDFLQIAKVCCILQNIAGCYSNRGFLPSASLAPSRALFTLVIVVPC